MASGQKLKRRNHTVNRSYLRRFADVDGVLTRVDLPGDKRVQLAVSDATVIKNCYVVTLSDGSETDLAGTAAHSDTEEDAFGLVESAAAEAMRSIADHMTWPIPRRVREDIAGWAALQYLRGPWVRQLGRELAKQFSGAGVSVKGDDGEQFVVRMAAEGLAELTGPSLQLQLIQRQLPV